MAVGEQRREDDLGDPSPSLVFPGQLVGNPGSPQLVTLTNTGDVPVTISRVAVAGDFRRPPRAAPRSPRLVQVPGECPLRSQAD